MLKNLLFICVLIFAIGRLSYAQNNLDEQSESESIEEEYAEDEYEEDEETDETSSEKKVTINFESNELVQKILKSYQAASEEEVAKSLEERIRVLPIGPLFKENSKWFTFLAKVLRDEEALPKFFGILNQRNRLLIFLVLNILIIIAGYMWKRSHKSSKDEIGFLGKVKRTFTRIFVIEIFRLTLFLTYFNDEIKPFWEITKRTFF